MDPAEFQNGPGRIEPYGGLPCYNPSSLPPEIEFSEDVVRVYGDALYALGQLSTLHDRLENENHLLAPFVVREAAMSSQIEGTNVTVSDIILHDPNEDPKHSAIDYRDIREAYNYVDAIDTGFTALKETGQVTRELICDLHELLLVDVRGEDKRPGEIRDTPVIIGSSRNPDDARFIPANPDHVSLLLDQLLSYMQMTHFPPLVDIALSHYQFETIHPFRDGNGRLGRLLIMLQLYEANLLSEPYLYLSAYFNRNRSEYFDTLLAVSRDGDWETWICFVLNAIAEQAIDAYTCGTDLVTLRSDYLETYPGMPVVRDVVNHLFAEPYLRASRAHEATGRPKKSIYNAIDRLEEDGIVEEITGRDRNQIFRAPDILALVESS